MTVFRVEAGAVGPVEEAILTGHVQQGETCRMSDDLEDSLEGRATS
jgi:hypothetical protein